VCLRRGGRRDRRCRCCCSAGVLSAVGYARPGAEQEGVVMERDVDARVYDALERHGLDLPLSEFWDHLQDEVSFFDDLKFAAYAVQVLMDMSDWASFDESDKEMVRKFGTLYVELKVLVSDLLRRNPNALI